MKRTIVILLLSALFLSCSTRVIQKSFPEKFEGLTQLVLASQTRNVTFTETVKKRVLGIFVSKAQVKVHSNVTFDFYLDFEKDGYKIELDEDEKSMTFLAPPIRVKKPIINSSTVSYPETGILVNEDKEAVKILENLTDRFIAEGTALLNEQRVMDMCTEKLSEFLEGLCTEFGYKVETINIITVKNN